MRRHGPLLALVLCALALRLLLAGTTAYVHDEVNTAIPLADSISFTPGSINLPLRGENHGALPAYIVHVSRTVFGRSPLGTRTMHVLLGIATILLIYRLAHTWFGATAAYWSAALMAFNEYYLDVSSRATAHVPHLFFAGAAIFLFVRFLCSERAINLYGAGAALGLAFYCKEHSALLLPLCFATLLRAKYRPWLRRPHPYLACALFVALLLPDLAWNRRSSDEPSRIGYGDMQAEQATYRAHLRRIGGLGLSPYPAMFYARDEVTSVHRALTGQQLVDATPEYQSMNGLLGILLLGAVALTLFSPARRVDATAFLLLVFLFIFGFFTFIKKGNPPGRLDPVSWIWVEVTLMPAVVLGGARLAAAGGMRIAAWTAAAAGLAYAAAAPLIGLGRSTGRAGQEAVSWVSHVIQVMLIATVASVRERPLVSIAIAVAASGIVGLLAGFAAGWFARGRR